MACCNPVPPLVRQHLTPQGRVTDVFVPLIRDNHYYGVLGLGVNPNETALASAASRRGERWCSTMKSGAARPPRRSAASSSSDRPHSVCCDSIDAVRERPRGSEQAETQPCEGARVRPRELSTPSEHSDAHEP